MRFALPTETFPIAALVAGGVFVSVRALGRPFERGTLARFRWIASLSATLLSALYVVFYLRGGPRVIDATSYFLEARALSEGHLAWDVPDPATSAMGRFLARDTLDAGQHMGVIFPPGWPAVLALGFWLGAPLAVGPVIAGALVWLTISLTHTVAVRSGFDPFAAQTAARLAGALGVVCAALRYHTADTMAHGLAALCVLAALSAALGLARGAPSGSPSSTRRIVALGFALGWLFATRPVSGAACALVCVFVIGRLPKPREIFFGACALAPGLLLLLLHQRAVTGAWLVSSQSLYYLQADHPAGCFRYGLGPEVGCLQEHGDFVRRYLPSGYDLPALVGTTLRRLQMHGVDALNAEPLALVLALAVIFGLRARGTRALAAALPAFVFAYAPFYFDGNYPGGGARFFAEVLPIEHALIALFVTKLAATGRFSWVPRAPRSAVILVGLSLVGFGVRAHVDHAHLRDREGGAPMFEADLLERAGIASGLVFVDTDHGFSLGYDPGARADQGAVEIARYRGDLSDRLLFDARSKPPSYRYAFDLQTGAVLLVPYVPRETARLEAETLWPALEQRGGAVIQSYGAPHCRSDGRCLTTDTGDGRVRLWLALPRAMAGRTIRLLFDRHPGVWKFSVIIDGSRLVPFEPLELVAYDPEAPLDAPRVGPWLEVPPASRSLSLVLERGPIRGKAEDRDVSLDAIEVAERIPVD